MMHRKYWKQARTMNKYLDHFGTDKPVFAMPDEIEGVYLPETTKQLRKRIGLFCEQGGSLLAITGSLGVGKSCIARCLYDILPTESYEVLLMSLLMEKENKDWFFLRLAESFGLSDARSKNYDLDELRAAVFSRFDDLIEDNKKLVVIIDAAE